MSRHAMPAAPAPVETSLIVPDVLVRNAQRVQHGGADDDRGAVLIVVEHRNVHALAQLALDLEALRRLDVLEIDAAERRLEARR